jgi:hypothetical protein
MTSLKALVHELRQALREDLIPLDTAAVKKLASKLEDELAKALENKQGTIKPGELALVDFTLPDVKGDKQRVFVQLVARPSRSPYFVPSGGLGHTKTGQKVVQLYVNASLPAESLHKAAKAKAGVADQIYDVLAHELTHAADVFSQGVGKKMSMQQASENPAEYYNDPSEVRAFMRNIVDEATMFYLKLLKRVKKAQALDWAFKNSTTWREIEPHLNPKNRKLVLKTVTGALEKAAEES